MSRFHLKNTNLRRILALTLVLLMVFSTMQSSGFGALVTAFAEDTSEEIVQGPDENQGGDPADPGDDNDPANPGDGNDPANPGDDNDPANPGDDNDPANPGDGNDPANPGDDNDPANPGDDDDPANPGDDDDPANPGDDNDGNSVPGALGGQLMSLLLPFFEMDASNAGAYVKGYFLNEDAGSGWEIDPSDETHALVNSTKVFKLVILFNSPDGAAMEEDLFFSGDYLDSVNFIDFHLGEERIGKQDSNSGVQPYYTITQVEGGYKLHCRTTAVETPYVYADSILLKFNSHTSDGSISLDAASVLSDSLVRTVSEKTTPPTLTVSNTVGSSGGNTFYQMLANLPADGSITVSAKSEAFTNSASDAMIPYLQDAQLKQTVVFSGFTLSSEPAIVVKDLSGAVIPAADYTLTYTKDSQQRVTGYTVTYAKSGGTGAAEIPMPSFTSYVTIAKNNMNSTTGATSQSIVASSVATGTPIHRTEQVASANPMPATLNALRYAAVNWTVDGVSGNKPAETQPRTNIEPDVSNVAQYNIHADFSSMQNPTHFILQGEGTAGGAGKVPSNYRNDYVTEVTSIQIKDENGAVILNSLDEAVNRGMLTKEGNKYYLLYDNATGQSYMPLKADANSMMLWSGMHSLDIGIKTTIKLTDQVASLTSGTRTAVRFFMGNGATGNSTKPADNAPLNSQAGYVSSLYIDVVHDTASLGIKKTGVYDGQSTITYTVELSNDGTVTETGRFIDNWPSVIALQQIVGVQNAMIKLTFEGGGTEEFLQTSNTYYHNGGAVTQIEIYGFPVAAGAKKSFTIIGQTGENMPFTIGNSVSSGSGGGHGHAGLIIADVITKDVFSNEACTDPIEGTETVTRGNTVYFRVQVQNDGNRELYFALTDSSQLGMTLVGATFNGTAIPLGSIDVLGESQASANDPVYNNYRYPAAPIAAGGTGTWVMAYTVDTECRASTLLNHVYAEAIVQEGEFEHTFRTQKASASITLTAVESADLHIQKSVSPFVVGANQYGKVSYNTPEDENWVTTVGSRESDKYSVGEYALYEVGVWNDAEALGPAPVEYLYEILPENMSFMGILDGEYNGQPNHWASYYVFHNLFGINSGNTDSHFAYWFLGSIQPDETGHSEYVSAWNNSMAQDAALRPTYINTHYFTNTMRDAVNAQWADCELSGKVKADGFDEQGRLIFDVKETNGDPLMLDPGEGFWFSILCRVDGEPTFTDESLVDCYRNTFGVQSISWAIADPDDSKENLEASVDIYARTDSDNLTVSKRAWRKAKLYEDGSTGETIKELVDGNGKGLGITIVDPIDIIEYVIDVQRPSNGVWPSEIVITDIIPSNYTFRLYTDGKPRVMWYTRFTDGVGGYGYYNGVGIGDYIQVDPNNAQKLIIKINSYTCPRAVGYWQTHNPEHLYFGIAMEPVEDDVQNIHARTTYHSDTNYVSLHNNAHATWTTYALGEYGVLLQKSHTIRGITSTTDTPVVVSQGEEYLYTLSAQPKFNPNNYYIDTITFTDQLPNTNDGRDSEFNVTFANPDITNDISVKITDINNAVTVIDPQYYSVEKNGYNLTVTFNDDFNTTYCGANGIVKDCKSFDVSVPVKAELLPSGVSPFSAAGVNKLANNRFNFSYNIYPIGGGQAVHIPIDSNIVTEAISGITGSVQIVKALENAENVPLAEQRFIFALTAGTSTDAQGNPIDTPMPVTHSKLRVGAGNVSFDGIPFSRPGTYRYTITETRASSPKWQMSGGPITATVTVSETTPTVLTYSVAYTNAAGVSSNVITNTYSSTRSATVVKVWQNGYHPDALEVELLANGESMSPAKTVTLNEDNEWTATISELPINDDNGNEITYTWSETLPAGYTLVSNETEGTVTTITNTYSASGSVELKAKKNYNKILTANMFTFTLSEGNTVLQTKGNAVNGDVAFDPLNYTLSDIGTHTYKIKEVIPANPDPKITYDETEYTIVVTVANNGDGTLLVLPTLGGSPYSNDDPVTFNNSYTMEGSLVLEGMKTLTDKALQAEMFTFELYEGTDTSGTAMFTTTNGEDGRFTFPEIQYEEAGEHTYTVIETEGNLAGVTYDETVYRVYVSVTEGTSALVATPTYKKVTAAGEVDANGIAFTNAYTANGSATIEGTKVLTGRDLRAEEFSFSLYQRVGSNDVLKQTVTNEAGTGTPSTGAFAFAPLEYTQADIGKTYTYYVRENEGTNAGIDYDDTSYKVTVKITDNGNGSLNTKVTVTNGPIEFNNTYDATGSIVFEPTKTLSNKTLDAGMFSFELYEGASATGTPKQTKTNKANGKVTFDAISYGLSDAGKTFTYTVKEVIPEEADRIPGVTYDTAVYTITVRVSDNGDGTLKTTIAGFKKNDTVIDPRLFAREFKFANTYTEDGQIVIDGTKNLEGRALADGEFSFELYDSNNQRIGNAVTNDANGAFAFPAREYTLSDVANSPFTYTVKEVQGSLPGIAYDESVFTVTVTVAQGDDGKLDVSKTVTKGNDTVDAIAFNNTYTATGYLDLTATKTLENKDLEAGDFSFEVYEGNTKIGETKTNTASGAVTFDRINYDLDDVGTHTYTVKEVIPEEADRIPGVTYDTAVYTVTVTVADSESHNGNLVVTKTITNAGGTEVQSISFNNTYSASGSVVIGGTKTLSGRTLAAEQFTFNLYKGTDTTGTPWKTATNAADKSFAFEEITYTLEDLGGDTSKEFTYTVTEVNAGAAGYTYDNTVYTVTVTVTNNGEGELVATPSYKVGGESKTKIEFRNSYSGRGTWTPTATKKLIGRDLAANEFTFELYKDSPDGTLVETKKNVAGTGTPSTSTVTFNEITFNQTGTFWYYIKEVIPAEDSADRLPGVKYDDSLFKVKVVVTDNGDGTFTVKETPYKNDIKANVIFTNEFAASDEITISGTKILTGRDLVDGQFSFGLYDSEDNPIGNPVTNDENGAFIFQGEAYGLQYDQDHLGNYTYKVREVNAGAAGYNYDGTVYTVEVNVALVGGELKITKTITKPSSADPNVPEIVNNIVFNNTYEASGTLDLSATKNLTGRALNAGEFTFELYEGETLLQTKTNAAGTGTPSTGAVTFETITYNQTHVGTHTYTVKEVIPAEGDAARLGGVGYDGSVYTVTVTVADNGNGTLDVTKVIKKGTETVDEIVFNNTYSTKTTLTLGGTKTLNGRGLKAEEFSFQLRKDKSTGTVLQTVTNAADGKFTFAPLTYTQADAGKTYTYVVREVKGSLGGVTYDTTLYTVTVAVTDDGQGNLTATPTIKKGSTKVEAITFTNTYTAFGALELEGDKRLSGRSLDEGEFTFGLYKGDDREPLRTATNDKKGHFAFKPIEYTLADKDNTYTYTVREIIPPERERLGGVRYDETIYTVTVSITDKGDGSLNVRSTVTKGGIGSADGRDPISIRPSVSVPIVFENSYTAKGSIDFSAVKTLSGKTLAAEQFEFELYEGKTKLQTVKNTADGVIAFNKIEYTQDDLGEHIYTVKEVLGNETGYVYDDTVYTISVAVSDKGDGTLGIEKKIMIGEKPVDAITFANQFVVRRITVNKSWVDDSDRDGLRPDSITFQLTQDGSNYGDPVTVQAPAAFANTWAGPTWSNLPTYKNGATLSNKTAHVYKVTEVPVPSGYTFKSPGTITKATVTATNTHVPELISIPVVKYWDDVDNQYGKRPESITVKLFKDGELFRTVTIQAPDPNDPDGGGEFDASDDFYDPNTPVAVRAKSVEGGKKWLLTFNNLYKYRDHGTPIVYTISEEAVKYYHEPKIESIVDNGKAGFQITNKCRLVDIPVVKYWDDVDNKYEKRPESITVKLFKDGELFRTVTIQAPDPNDPNAGGTYDPTDDIRDPETPVVVRAKEAEGGKKWLLTFINLYEFENSDSDTPIVYTISEDQVKPYQKPKIEPFEDEYGKKGFLITNKYRPGVPPDPPVDPFGRITFTATKELTGATLRDGMFTFELYEKKGDEGETKLVQTKTNAANGSITFDEIVYTPADTGNYTYTIKEVAGSVEGMTYDDTVYTIKVKVVDDGEQIIVTATGAEGIVFHNTYEGDNPPGDPDGSITLRAKKILDGAKLKDAMFTFELYEGETKLQTKTNTASGSITFDRIVYESAGTHTYTIKEVAGSIEGILYDATVYTVTVTVVNEGGKLKVTATGAEDIVFNNTAGDDYDDDPDDPYAPYEEDEDDKKTPHAPYTGDDRHTAYWLLLALLSMGGAVALGRKREEE